MPSSVMKSPFYYKIDILLQCFPIILKKQQQQQQQQEKKKKQKKKRSAVIRWNTVAYIR